MKIKCIKNEVTNSLQESKNNVAKKFPLLKEKEYIVYGLCAREKSIWYCICDENYFFYPKWHSDNFFEVIDQRLSRYWLFNYRYENDQKTPFLSFPEWANNDHFYNDLLDGNGGDLEAVIFRKYKELMDLEFPDPSIIETAQIGDEEWLICPTCLDAWQSKNSQDALIKCPKCQKIYNNPRYKNELLHL